VPDVLQTIRVARFHRCYTAIRPNFRHSDGFLRAARRFGRWLS
jgi:hypothetical protein